MCTVSPERTIDFLPNCNRRQPAARALIRLVDRRREQFADNTP
jgi:hypothetical protein